MKTIDLGNVIGPQGIQGERGVQGKVALECGGIIKRDHPPNGTEKLSLHIANCNRTPEKDDVTTILYEDTSSGDAYHLTLKVTEENDGTYFSCNQLQHIKVNGVLTAPADNVNLYVHQCRYIGNSNAINAGVVNFSFINTNAEPITKDNLTDIPMCVASGSISRTGGAAVPVTAVIGGGTSGEEGTLMYFYFQNEAGTPSAYNLMLQEGSENWSITDEVSAVTLNIKGKDGKAGLAYWATSGGSLDYQLPPIGTAGYYISFSNIQPNFPQDNSALGLYVYQVVTGSVVDGDSGTFIAQWEASMFDTGSTEYISSATGVVCKPIAYNKVSADANILYQHSVHMMGPLGGGGTTMDFEVITTYNMPYTGLSDAISKMPLTKCTAYGDISGIFGTDTSTKVVEKVYVNTSRTALVVIARTPGNAYNDTGNITSIDGFTDNIIKIN